jgi:hypothetical protein
MNGRQTGEARLAVLIEASLRNKEKGAPRVPADSIGKLSQEKRAGWARFLSSIATTESIEEAIIAPIGIHHAFASPSAQEFLRHQEEDERRHFDLLTDYVKETFDYRKTKKSVSDLVIYDTILPKLGRLFRDWPVGPLVCIQFYEAFSLYFYKLLKECATRDELFGLVSILEAIEKDELRHLSGIGVLVQKWKETKGLPGKLEVTGIRALLQLLLIDIDLAPWAIHNREVRRSALAIGLDVQKMGKAARKSANETLEKLSRYEEQTDA